MRVFITKDYEEMSERAFEIVKELVVENPYAVLGLATGTTPLGLYGRMKADHKKNGTSYRHVRTVNLDEYMGLPAVHEQSYAYFMKKNLFDGLDIDLNNTHIENGMASSAEEECENYNRLLKMLRQDIQILGIGSNGHIAFNEPGTPFNSQTHVVELAESTIKDNARLFKDVSEVPRKAFTMGLKNIMDAKKIVVLANGANKAKAVKEAIQGNMSENVPASILQSHEDCTFICDEQAAALL